MIEQRFPKEFQWGVTTAAYQIEGGVREGGRGETIWDRFSHIPGNILNGDTGDIACDSYHRLEEDIAMLKELGVNAYRFSIAWARIYPRGYGEVSKEGIHYYERLIDGLLEANIEPYVTLYHWDLPQKLQDQGGWTNRETAVHFAKYSQLMFDLFGNKVKKWITFNEPWVACFLGHYTGIMAPGIRDFSAALEAAHTMLVSHGMAVERYRRMHLNGEIGIVLNLGPKQALTSKPEDEAAAVRMDGYMNRWFLDPLYKGQYPQDMWNWYENQGVTLPEILDGDMELISKTTDFLGFNYYCIDYAVENQKIWPICLESGFSGGNPMSHYNQPIIPDGLKQILIRLHREYQPGKLYITENGLSYQDYPNRNGQVLDYQRIDYIYTHLMKSLESMEEAGVPLAGYFVWSLLDNFEWNTGYENQFGLVHVERNTQKRTKKQSYYWYKQVIASNGQSLFEEGN